MIHVIQQALEPGLSLASVLAHWARIAEELKEPARERQLQIDIL